MPTIRATSDTIACTLSADELMDVGAAWQKLFRTSLISRDLVPGGLRLTVHPGAAPALKQLIDIESECCGWITFELDGPELGLRASGASGAFQYVGLRTCGTNRALAATKLRSAAQIAWSVSQNQDRRGDAGTGYRLAGSRQRFEGRSYGR